MLQEGTAHISLGPDLCYVTVMDPHGSSAQRLDLCEEYDNDYEEVDFSASRLLSSVGLIGMSAAYWQALETCSET